MTMSRLDCQSIGHAKLRKLSPQVFNVWMQLFMVNYFKSKALKGRPIIAQGKCESASAPPWVNRPKTCRQLQSRAIARV